MNTHLLKEIYFIDSKLDEIRRKKKENDLLKEITEVKKMYELYKKRYLELVDSIKEKKDKQNELSIRIKKLYSEVNEAEKQLYSGNNTKMLSQLQMKIDAIKMQIKELEEMAFEVMVDIDDITKDAKIIGSELNKIKIRFEELKEGLAVIKANIEETINELLERRNNLVSKLDENIYKEYEHLKTKLGKGAAEIINENFCSGCRIQLPLLLVEKVKKSSELYKCPNCNRFLII